MMSVVLQHFYCKVGYFEIITTFDAHNFEVSGKFCIEAVTRSLVRIVGCPGLEIRKK